MKRDDALAGMPRQSHGSGFCDVGWTARSIDRECDIYTIFKTSGHLSQCSSATSCSRTSGRPVSVTFNHSSCVLRVSADARHDHNAAIPPEPAGTNNTDMPEGENRSLPVGIDSIQVLAPANLPSQSRT